MAFTASESAMNELYKKVCEDIRRYCQAKGYREGDGVNNFVPHDAVAAFGMARLLAHWYDRYVAVAPEGHIYGYFFERLDVPVLSVFTDYPPTRCTSDDDLSVLENQRVLLIEDDVVSGRTLQLVVDYLEQFKPAWLGLYLGHSIGVQHFENIPPQIAQNRVIFSELMLSPNHWKELDVEFPKFFRSLLEGAKR
jgi:hypothetical protein